MSENVKNIFIIISKIFSALMKGTKLKDHEFPALDVHGINMFIDGRELIVK